MTQSVWKGTPPAAPGLYVASTERRADTVRCWTGNHWTAPCMARDLYLTERVPQMDWPPACPARRKAKIEWLEPVTIDRDGFVSWAGQLTGPPVPASTGVVVKLRSRAKTEDPLPAGAFHWRADGSVLDPVAYRVVPQ